MNAVTLTIQTQPLLDLFDGLPHNGTIESIRIDGELVRIVYHHPEITHARDYPMDYDEWMPIRHQAVPDPKPFPPPQAPGKNKSHTAQPAERKRKKK